MALKTFRPLTPSLRFTELNGFEEITTGNTPVKKLTERIKKTGGRNSYGRVTSRHIGGGHKQRYRFIDFKRNKHGVKAIVETIEYDPNRTARIALLKYADGEQRYILAPVGLNVGVSLSSGPEAEPIVGNSLPLEKIPLGAPIHNIELIPGRGAQIGRTAGSSATVMSVDAGYAQVRLPSGEIRKIFAQCYATIGQVGNLEHENVSLGKAGRSRWLGRRPHVRGMVMNPVDHPMGGGQGKSKGGGGRQHPVSPWGQPAKGLKTRPKYKPSNKFIVERRKNKKH
ncbi:MAG: 50S ribosomal protein L2 [Methylacidiphilales bacterium]|nr:50S ribosomal protein L2 [Candidatus Methylacidiphilales bacterium]